MTSLYQRTTARLAGGKKLRRILWVMGLLALLVITGLASQRRGIPFVSREGVWSIGIYTGQTLFDLQEPAGCVNPVLTADDIADVSARYVADPFLVRNGDGWVMLFEVFNRENWRGEIAFATSSDGCAWHYGGIVLREPFHLSYPYVVQVDGEYFMIPESGADKSVRLYHAKEFPQRWEYVGTLLAGEPFRDSSVFFHDSVWWMFTAIEKKELRLYYADQLSGPWLPHPNNPIIANDPSIARSGGRVTAQNGQLYRLTQDDQGSYGRQVRAFAITELSKVNYRESIDIRSPIVTAGHADWNNLGMHHVDLQPITDTKFIASVDGLTSHFRISLKH